MTDVELTKNDLREVTAFAAARAETVLGVFEAARAAMAAELEAGHAATHVEQAIRAASPAVVRVLGRYPAAPSGGVLVGELIRILDDGLRR